MASDALAFDTHRFVKRMTAAGMPVQQAEALAESQSDLLNANLATKNELANTESTLRADIANTEAHLIKWMVGLTMGSVGVMIALFSFFLR